MYLWRVLTGKLSADRAVHRRHLPRARSVRLSIAGLATAGVMAAGLPSASAFYQPMNNESPVVQAELRWGERTAAAEYDCDGDDVHDVFVASPGENVSGILQAGRVRLVSGASLTDATTGAPTVLATFTSPQPQANARFGFYIAVLDHDPDVDTETPWIAIGTDAQDDQGYVDIGKAWVFDDFCTGGNSAQYALNNPYPQGSAANQARFGSRLGNAGDMNNDGKAEVIVGASGNDWVPESAGGPPGCGQAGTVPPGCRKDQGQAFIFDGNSGSLLRRLEYPLEDRALNVAVDTVAGCQTLCGSFGIAVQGPGDTDGDGIVDHLVDSTNFGYGVNVNTGTGPNYSGPGETGPSVGRMYVFIGGSSIPPSAPPPPPPGGPVVPLSPPAGSINTSFHCPTPGPPAAPSTPCEEIRLKIDNPEPLPASFFGFQDAAPLSPGDVGKCLVVVTGQPCVPQPGTPDGFDDLYGNGFLQTPAGGLPAEGMAWVFDGFTGTPLYPVKDPTPNPGGQFGWAMTKNVPNHLRDTVTVAAGAGDNPDDKYLYVGASPHFIPGNQNGGTSLHLKANGVWDPTTVYTELPPECSQLPGTSPAPPNVSFVPVGNVGPNLGWTVSAPGDLNGDGEPDYVAGSPFMDRGQTRRNEGLVFAFASTAGLPALGAVCPPGGPLEQHIP